MPKGRLSVSVVGSGATPLVAQDMVNFARKAESAGFYALYLTDHIFDSKPTLYSGSVCAVIAAATTTLRIGFSSYILPFRHPIVAAKELAFVDGLSQGRLIPGLAAGSSKAEFAAFGIDFHTRGKRFDEGLVALQRLWLEDDVTFAGTYYNFDKVCVNPKPVQSPCPPIWIGSWTGSRPAARRIVEHAAGWQASALHCSLDEVTQGWQRIEDMCAQMGRDPASLGRAMVNLVLAVADTRAGALRQVSPSYRLHEELIVAGNANEVSERLLQIFDTGVDEVSVLLPSNALEQLDLIAEHVLPQL